MISITSDPLPMRYPHQFGKLVGHFLVDAEEEPVIKFQPATYLVPNRTFTVPNSTIETRVFFQVHDLVVRPIRRRLDLNNLDGIGHQILRSYDVDRLLDDLSRIYIV